jgi:hypothetical protein
MTRREGNPPGHLPRLMPYLPGAAGRREEGAMNRARPHDASRKALASRGGMRSECTSAFAVGVRGLAPGGPLSGRGVLPEPALPWWELKCTSLSRR